MLKKLSYILAIATQVDDTNYAYPVEVCWQHLVPLFSSSFSPLGLELGAHISSFCPFYFKNQVKKAIYRK